MVEKLVPDIIKKPWGYEKILSSGDTFVVKKLFIKAGHKLSMQYHMIKTETIFLVEGDGFIIIPKQRGGFNGEEIYIAKSSRHSIEALDKSKMIPFKPYFIPPNRLHRIGATTDVTLIEVSTTELDDVVRLTDDYGRGR